MAPFLFHNLQQLMAAQKLLPFFLITLVVLSVDLYVFYATRNLIGGTESRKWFGYFYWGFTLFTFLFFLYFRLVGQDGIPRLVMLFSFSSFFIVFLSKFIFSLILLLGDGARGISVLFDWTRSMVLSKEPAHSPARSAALVKIGLSIAAVPFFSLLYGMVKGAHRYQVRNVSLKLKNLPEAFRGLKIVQISDIHTGSFYDKSAVSKGIDLILKQKPDLIFFTGDLVNNEASEVVDYLDLFKKIQAPMGVFSVLGNHDYGDYVFWASAEAKKENLQQLMAHQKNLGWRLLMDEHVTLEKNGETMAVIGIQNWGAKGRFPKYGNLKKAYEGSEKHPVKLLLSHDPSHWEAQVLPEYPEIDAMFSGHTHGMQFGIDIPGLKWSPVQYMYKQWAGLYENGTQKLYVNRGFGFIGYPGRVGIWPEITTITLEKA